MQPPFLFACGVPPRRPPTPSISGSNLPHDIVKEVASRRGGIPGRGPCALTFQPRRLVVAKTERRPFHGPPQGSPLLGVHQLREDCPLSQWRARVGCPIFSRVHHSTRNPLLRARRLPVATSAAGPRGALRVGRPAFAKSGPQPPVPKTACVGNREGRSHSGEPPAGWDARGFTPLPERACGNVGADVVGESPNGRPWTPPPQAGAWMTPGAKTPEGHPRPWTKLPAAASRLRNTLGSSHRVVRVPGTGC
jgi:hypothetical protein